MKRRETRSGAADRQRRRLEIEVPFVPPRRRLGVLAPLADVPVLVDMGGDPQLIGVERIAAERQRDQRRTGDRAAHFR